MLAEVRKWKICSHVELSIGSWYKYTAVLDYSSTRTCNDNEAFHHLQEQALNLEILHHLNLYFLSLNSARVDCLHPIQGQNREKGWKSCFDIPDIF